MTRREHWQHWEDEVAQHLGLDTTIHSGIRFFDPGDAVTRGNEGPFPLLADCKYTESHSFSLRSADLRQMGETAMALGKRFILPLRFALRNGLHVGGEDYVVLSFHDFKELLDGYRV
jgi:hypothetical protein